MRKRAEVTPKLFDCVKQLLVAGSTIAEISDYLEIGHTTVSRIKSAENWEEYKQILAAIAVKARQEKEKSIIVREVPAEQPHVPDRTKQMYTQNEYMRLLREQNQLLREQNELVKRQALAWETLSAKLVFIVESLS